MKGLVEFINENVINEGFKDSFVNVIKNLFSHGEVSNKDLVTIEIDPKIFGKLVRDKEYFSPETKDYPKLIPLTSMGGVEDLWELYKCEIGEDKYGDEKTMFTYIGHADFRKDKNKIEVDKNYKELIEQVFAKYK